MGDYPTAGTATEMTKQVTPIQRVINENGELLDMLHNAIDKLTMHLSPVLTRAEQAGERVDDGSKKAMPGSSQQIEQLLAHQSMIERAVRYVKNLEAALEV